MGFTYTLMKGKENVLSEVNLLFSIYNLKRVLSILGSEELRKRLKDQILLLLDQIGLEINSFKKGLQNSHILLNRLLISTEGFICSQERYFKYI